MGKLPDNIKGYTVIDYLYNKVDGLKFTLMKI